MGIWDAVITDRKEDAGESAHPCTSEGAICPNCKEGTLEYDGKLHLVCSKCQTEFSQGFT